MIDLLLWKNRIAIFLEQKKNNSNHRKHVKGFQLLEAVISLASGQIATFCPEIFCQHQLENYFGS